jgi:hypothetical protein
MKDDRIRVSSNLVAKRVWSFCLRTTAIQTENWHRFSDSTCTVIITGPLTSSQSAARDQNGLRLLALDLGDLGRPSLVLTFVQPSTILLLSSRQEQPFLDALLAIRHILEAVDTQNRPSIFLVEASQPTPSIRPADCPRTMRRGPLQALCVGFGLSTAVIAQDSLDTWLERQVPYSLQGVLDNIGPDGAKVSGSHAGIVVASPSKSEPDCKAAIEYL